MNANFTSKFELLICNFSKLHRQNYLTMSHNLFPEAAYSAVDGRADEKDYIDPSVKSRSLDLDFKGVTHDSKTEEE